ncbi:porin family protein [Myroides sp. JBRI-B21084]|uniref:porin family protein n=1 Tax=Myroides sp. JBRI-B21084 TaxID=3119977 RepID=UPI0026E1526A|nr:porin family protein [Paenimyroides cloacae]WKW47143.1 porin family protein [Paenimyroides cloacae]
MKIFFNILAILFFTNIFAQATDSLPILERTIKVTDPYYREDQFYVGITHSLLINKPENVLQRSISIGTNFGFLRDFPLNKQRTVAIAPGLGFAFYNLRHNLAFTNNAFQIDNNPEKNVEKLTYFEIPIEFRWRTSKVHSHKFWRIYSGIKYSYLLNSNSKYKGDLGSFSVNNSNYFTKSNIGVYVSAGFNTWNFYAYYGFKPLYSKNAIDHKSYFNMINLGLMFYIL